MPAFLSQEWLDLQRSLAADLPERPGVTASLQIVVTGTPSGEVRYVQAIEDGRVAASALGRSEDADVTLTCSSADAVAIAKGDLDMSAAFMQGRVKVVGDVGSLMAVMPFMQSRQYRQLNVTVGAQTEF